MSNVHVAWAMPNYGSVWPPAYESHLRCIAYASRHLTVHSLGSVAGVGITDRMPLDAAENALVEQALALEHCTHVFLTESDMCLPDATIVDLLALDKPIASGIYFLRNGNGQPCLYKRMVGLPANPYAQTPLTIFPLEQPFRLDGCPGFGCVLIKREVFEKMSKPWFDIKQGHHGSDLYFYTNAVKAGFEVWIDPRVRCGQVEYISWEFEHYRMRLQSDPTFASSGGIVGMAEVLR
jgi:hypothetical protein